MDDVGSTMASYHFGLIDALTNRKPLSTKNHDNNEAMNSHDAFDTFFFFFFEWVRVLCLAKKFHSICDDEYVSFFFFSGAANRHGETSQFNDPNGLVDLPFDFEIAWTTMQGSIVGGGVFVNGRTIRFSIEDSSDCGKTNSFY